MKLRNKKTGKVYNVINESIKLSVGDRSAQHSGYYTSLAELNEEWEDYEESEELKESKKYWFINSGGEIVLYYEEDEEPEDTESYKQIDNYFNTREEAEKAVEKLKAWKRLKDNGFKIKGWKFTPDMKQIEGNYVKIEAEIPQILINEKDLDLLFGGEE